MASKKKDRKSTKGHSAEDGASKLAEHLEVNTVTSAMAYMSCGFDNSWNHDGWADNFAIEVTETKGDFFEFEMKNIDPALVNALRRILIAEVPTVCIEHVFVVDNTSVMQEEVLSHRLGLVPLKIDPEQLSWKEDKATEANTVVFKLHVECSRVRLRVKPVRLTPHRQGQTVLSDKLEKA